MLFLQFCYWSALWYLDKYTYVSVILKMEIIMLSIKWKIKNLGVIYWQYFWQQKWVNHEINIDIIDIINCVTRKNI